MSINHSDKYLPGALDPDDEGAPIQRPEGPTAQAQDAKFQTALANAMRRGLERPRHGVEKADPSDERLLKSYRAVTYVPSASPSNTD